MVRLQSSGGWLVLLLIWVAVPVCGQVCPSAGDLQGKIVHGEQISADDLSACAAEGQLGSTLDAMADPLSAKFVDAFQEDDVEVMAQVLEGMDRFDSALREAPYEDVREAFWVQLIERIKASGVEAYLDVTSRNELLLVAHKTSARVAREKLKEVQRQLEAAKKKEEPSAGESSDSPAQDGAPEGGGSSGIEDHLLSGALLISLLTFLLVLALGIAHWLAWRGKLPGRRGVTSENVLSEFRFHGKSMRRALGVLGRRLVPVLDNSGDLRSGLNEVATKKELKLWLGSAVSTLKGEWKRDLSAALASLGDAPSQPERSTRTTAPASELSGSSHHESVAFSHPVPSLNPAPQHVDSPSSSTPRSNTPVKVSPVTISNTNLGSSTALEPYSSPREPNHTVAVDLPGLDGLQSVSGERVVALLQKKPLLKKALRDLEKGKGIWGRIEVLVDRGARRKGNQDVERAWQGIFPKFLQPYWVGMAILRRKSGEADSEPLDGGEAMGLRGGRREEGEAKALLAIRELAKFSPQTWAEKKLVGFTNEMLEIRGGLEAPDAHVDEVLRAALEVLREVGLELIPIQIGVTKALSQLCEIVSSEERADLDDNVITSVVRHGFYYPESDEVLEPAKVVVSHRPRGQA